MVEFDCAAVRSSVSASGDLSSFALLTSVRVFQVQERFDVDITTLPDHIDKELYRQDE